MIWVVGKKLALHRKDQRLWQTVWFQSVHLVGIDGRGGERGQFYLELFVASSRVDWWLSFQQTLESFQTRIQNAAPQRAADQKTAAYASIRTRDGGFCVSECSELVVALLLVMIFKIWVDGSAGLCFVRLLSCAGVFAYVVCCVSVTVV